MATLVERLMRPLSRRTRVVGLPALFLALTLSFVYVGFPYERVASGLLTPMESASGVRIRPGEVRPLLSLLGPGLDLRELRIQKPGEWTWDFDRIQVRPAWSWSWLSGTAAVALDARSSAGRMTGTVYWGKSLGYSGEIAHLDLSRPAAMKLIPFSGLSGRLDADVDLIVDADGQADGRIVFAVDDGSLAVPGTPFAVPFASIAGDVALGGDDLALVESLSVTGPMLDATLSGRIAKPPGGVLERAGLDLQADVDAKADLAQNALRDLGVRLDRQGKGRIQLGGSLGRPVVQ